MTLKKFIAVDRQIVSNFFSLTIIQVINLIIPVLTLPYLLRVVGVEKYGSIALALNYFVYLICFIDYGFNLSGTKTAAIYKENLHKLSQLFSDVMFTKLLLFVAACTIVYVVSTTVTRLETDQTLYLFGITYLLGNALNPVWFLQGIEQMKFMTYANGAAKLVQIALLFVLVRNQEDYIYVIAISGFANLFSGILSTFYLIRNQNIVIFPPKVRNILEQLKTGWLFFFSNLSITVTNNITLVILSLYVSNEELGYYGICERIVLVFWTLLAVFSQSIYPKVCRLSEVSIEAPYQFVKRIAIPLLTITALGCLATYQLADYVIYYTAGRYVPESANLLRIMIVVPFIVSLNIPAYQLVLAYNFKSAYTLLFNVAALLNGVFCVLLVNRWRIEGAAFCMIITQSFITISLYFLLMAKSRLSSAL